MTEEEKTVLKMYLVNQGLRVDGELQEARQDFDQRFSSWSAFRLSLAHERKEVFDKFAVDLCALLHI